MRVVVTTMAFAAPAAPAGALAAASQAPTMVGPVRTSEHTSSSVRLRWAPARDDVGVVGYRVYRGRAGTPQGRLAHIATIDPASSYTASHLYSGTAYRFGIVAIDADDNASPMRTITVSTATRTDSDRPSPPSTASVSVRAFSASRIDVVWGPSQAGDVAGYVVLRNGRRIARIDLPYARRYSDNQLAPAHSYAYTIEAVDSAGNVSAPSSPRRTSTLPLGTRRVVRGPLVAAVTPTSAVISWWTNEATPGVVSWGLTSHAEQSAVDPAGAVHHHVVAIGGLAPGNRYGYQVGDGARLVANATFASAAPPGQSFSFAAIGDFGRGGAGELQNATLIASAGTSFVQTLGDNVYPAAGEPDPDFVHVYGDFDAWLYKPFATVFREQPLFPANGNKEYYSDGEFWQNVPMPGSNHSWYAYDWGDAHVLVLDSNRPTGPGSAQYAFARSDLAAHQASAWRIVVIHQPLYSSTTPRSSSPALRAALAPLFQQQRVGLVLSGNVHNYERTRPLIDGRPAEGGVTYVVSGGGGNGLNPITLPKPAYSAFREAVYYEFVRVTVTPRALVVDAIRADTGGVFDTATIRPR